MDDLLLRERMKAAADLAAGRARPPGAGAARRRGRRRQARAAVAVAVALLLVAATALLTPVARALWERSTPTLGGAPTQPASGPLGQRATGPVLTVERGTVDGQPWEYIAYESGDQVCYGFRSGRDLVGGGGACERFTEQTEPVIFGASAGRRMDGTAAPRFADGPVTKDAVQVRIALAGRAPIQLQPARPPGLPVHFFVVVLPPTAVATEVTAYDATGRIVGHQDLTGLPTARPEPARTGAGDAGWLTAMLRGAGYRTATGGHHVVTGTAGGRRVPGQGRLPHPPAQRHRHGVRQRQPGRLVGAGPTRLGRAGA